MKLTYFYDTNSYDEAKKLYRKKAIEFHPDTNKNVDIKLFQELNSQWQYINNNSIVYPILNPIQQQKKQEEKLNNNPSRLERVDVIKKLYQMSITKGYKKIWVYHQYIAECNFHNIKIEFYDIMYLGTLLGYSEGWANYKWQEILQAK